MDEPNSQLQNTEAVNTNDSSDSFDDGSHSTQIFDITPDLNIAPVDDNETNEAGISASPQTGQQTQKSPLDQSNTDVSKVWITPVGQRIMNQKNWSSQASPKDTPPSPVPSPIVPKASPLPTPISSLPPSTPPQNSPAPQIIKPTPSIPTHVFPDAQTIVRNAPANPPTKTIAYNQNANSKTLASEIGNINKTLASEIGNIIKTPQMAPVKQPPGVANTNATSQPSIAVGTDTATRPTTSAAQTKH